MLLNKRSKTMLIITLSVIIGLISPPGTSTNAEDDLPSYVSDNLTSQEKDLEFAFSSINEENSSYRSEEIISLNDIKDDTEKSIRYSVKFGGKDCYLILVPAPEINDPIGITAPETNDNIGITGDYQKNAQYEIIPKFREEVLDK